MTVQVVYFFWEQDANRFKIGISSQPADRRLKLSQRIDHQRSSCIECSGPSASRIETVLHTIFKGYKMHHPTGGEGRTEWFNGECWPEVERFLSIHQASLKCSPLMAIPQSAPKLPRPKLPRKKPPEPVIQAESTLNITDRVDWIKAFDSMAAAGDARRFFGMVSPVPRLPGQPAAIPAPGMAYLSDAQRTLKAFIEAFGWEGRQIWIDAFDLLTEGM